LLPAFSQPLDERGVALELDFPPQLPQVRVDPLQLEQALLEIVSNALDAMPDGGRLRIAGSLNGVGGEGGTVTLEIEDTGSGIPPQVLPSIYQPFFTTRQEGTGLGLAIAKRYVEQNGGTLEIISHAGGTTVRVRLPVASPAEASV
jgi:signal transduction histidine kinase